MSKHTILNQNSQANTDQWTMSLAMTNRTPKLINKLGKINNDTQPNRSLVVLPNDKHRSQVEAFIRRNFKKHHGAELKTFAPFLLANFNQENEIDAALGYRLAGDSPLFIETYLEQNIESLVSHYLGQSVSRNAIAETGNLASTDASSCKALFAEVTEHLHQQNLEWLVSSSTKVVRVLYRRLGIKAHVIHDVDKTRLGKDQHSWGSYYENQPKITLINIEQAKQCFQALNSKNHADYPH